MKYFFITIFLLFATIGICTSSGENTCVGKLTANATEEQSCLQMSRGSRILTSKETLGIEIKAALHAPVSADEYYIPINTVSYFILLQ